MSEIIEYNILQWNCNSLISKENVLNNILERYQPFIVALQETKINDKAEKILKDKKPFKNFTLYNTQSIEQTNPKVQPHGAGLLESHSVDIFEFANITDLDDKFKSDAIQIAATIVKLKKTNVKFVLASIYCKPCDTSDTFPIEELKEFVDYLQQNVKLPFLLLGDFNARSQVLEKNIQQTVNKKSKVKYACGDLLLEQFIEKQNLVLINNTKQPTRFAQTNHKTRLEFTPSTIDLSFCSADFITYIGNWFTLNLCIKDANNRIVVDGGSDHTPIIIQLNFEVPITTLQQKNTNKHDEDIFFGWKTNIQDPQIVDKFKMATKQIKSNISYDEFIKFIQDCLQESFKKHYIKKKYKHHPSSSWFNNHNSSLKDKLKTVKRLKKKYNKSKDAAIQVQIKKLKKDNKTIIKKFKKDSKFRKIESICIAKNSKHAWDVINDIKKHMTTQDDEEKKKMYCILDENDNKSILVTNQQKIADMFLTYYEKEFAGGGGVEKSIQLDEAEKFKDHKKLSVEQLEFLNKPFTIEEFNIAIEELNEKAAPSIVDKIPSNIFKMLSIEAKNVLLNILNKIYIGDFPIPKSWKLATIKPILKPHKDSLFLSSYRPVAVMVSSSKILERLMVNRFDIVSTSYKHPVLSTILRMDNKNQENALNPNLLTRNQYGFRKNIGTEDLLLRISNEISLGKHYKEDIVNISFDLKNAYGSMVHETILNSCENIGMDKSNNFYKFVDRTLQDQELQVKINNEITSTKSCKLSNFGVPQGSVLSPLLFRIGLENLFYLFDIFASERINSFIKNVNLIGYADDLYLVIRIKRYNLQQDTFVHYKDQVDKMIQSFINFIVDWLTKNSFNLNLNKINCLRISGLQKEGIKQPPLTLKIIDTNFQIQQVKEMKILGVTFDDKANFEKHLNEITHKAKQGLNILRILKGVNKNYINPDSLIKIYIALIRSQMEYGSVTYGDKASNTNLNKLEVINREGARISYSAFKTTPNDMLLATSGIQSLANRRLEKSTKTVLNICMYPATKWHTKLGNISNNNILFKTPNITTTTTRLSSINTIEEMIGQYLPCYFPKIWKTITNEENPNKSIRGFSRHLIINNELQEHLYTTTDTADIFDHQKIINHINTEFLNVVKNNDETMLKELFKDFLFDHYHQQKEIVNETESSPNDVLYVYTDGSKFEKDENASGLGIYFENHHQHQDKYGFKVNDLHSIFSIEALAIEKALDIIKEKIENNQINPVTTSIVIITDSKSVLEAIENFPTADASSTKEFLVDNIAHPFHNNIHIVNIIKKYNDLLSFTNKQLKLHFCWTKAHVDILGNEEADNLAKEAALAVSTKENTLISIISKLDILHYVKGQIKSKQMKEITESSSSNLKRQPLLDAKHGKLNRLPFPEYVRGDNAKYVSRIRLNYVKKVEVQKFKKKTTTPPNYNNDDDTVSDIDAEEEIIQVEEEDQLNHVSCQYCAEKYISFCHHYFKDCKNEQVVAKRAALNIDMTTAFETKDNKKIFKLLAFIKQLKLIDDI